MRLKIILLVIAVQLLSDRSAAAELATSPQTTAGADTRPATLDMERVRPERNAFRGASVTYDTQTNTISHVNAVREDGVHVDGAETPRQAADAFLRLHASEFGFTTTLEPLSAPRVFGTDHFHALYDQMYDGLPVFEGAVEVILDAKDNSITGIHANLVPITAPLEGRQFAPASEAVRAAVKVFGGHVNDVDRGHTPEEPAPRLGLLVEGGRPTPAWQIPLVTRGGNWWVMVDAMTLQILSADPGPRA